MNSFVELLDDLLVKINSSVDEKVFGIHFLENIKFQLIEQLIFLERNILEDFKSELSVKKLFSKKHVFNNRSINYNINYIENSVSKIKYTLEQDTLNIILDGVKIISVFDKNKKNIPIKINITKNKGIVLSQNTIISENINKNSIILSIMYD